VKSQRACTAASLLLGISLFATTLAGSAFAQSTSSSAAASGPASPWDQRVNADAVQADAWFQNYRFRNGGTLERVKIHYATLGTPHRNAKGEIDSAVLVLHWTGGDSRVLLSPTFTQALFNPGRPLDAKALHNCWKAALGQRQCFLAPISSPTVPSRRRGHASCRFLKISHSSVSAISSLRRAPARRFPLCVSIVRR
jgi:homoserine O-acetyltransferase